MTRPERDVDVTALMKLIETAYADMKARLKAEQVAQAGVVTDETSE